MQSPALRERLAATTHLQRILWLALTASIAIYAGVAFLVDLPREAAPPAALDPAFGVLAVATAAASHLWYRRSHDPQRLRRDALAPGAAGPRGDAPGGEPTPEEQRLRGVTGVQGRRAQPSRARSDW